MPHSKTKEDQTSSGPHPETKHQYTFVYKLTEAGTNNIGISVVRHQVTKKLLVCKELGPNNPTEEVIVLKRLRSHQNIVQLHDYHTRQGALGLFVSGNLRDIDKLYLEFCDPGSLQDVLDRYLNLPVRIPEAFIWEVCEGMAAALVYLHTGEHPATANPHTKEQANKVSEECGGGNAEENISTARPSKSTANKRKWDPIIHSDIHVENIFLSSIPHPLQSYSSIYPRVVLGDFGNSTPESSIHPMQFQYDPFPQLQDVFELGSVLDTLGYGIQLDPDWKDDKGWNAAPSKDVMWVYSEQLRRVIHACLEPDLGLRPDAARLLEMVRRARGELKGTIVEDEMLLP